ncbi:MAG: hypothetical protein HZB26_00900 [Candidatus Hydrogenedentes bacterium]|nr:hypothetical protein [Candidatus Hydrogenedentota bacterium]
MPYEYTGYLKTILGAPDESASAAMDHITFTADELSKWALRDIESDREWKNIPARCTRAGDIVRLEGRFEEIRRIDNLSPDDPSFWAPLGSLDINDPRFPIDVSRYPIAEITYRCTSSHARPAWLWTYPGGQHFDGLEPSRGWRTVARRIQHLGFPLHITGVVIRLYSTGRSTESCEIQSLRFRAMTPAEAEACNADETQLKLREKPKEYPILKEFLPLGVYMDAESPRRLAEMLGISLDEYWNLAMEDIVKHRHNCIALENFDRLTASEWSDLLACAERFGIKFWAIQKAFPTHETVERQRSLIETRIKPYANSPAVFAWSLYDEPPEHEFHNLLRAQAWVEEADPNHPFAIVSRQPTGYPLYAPFVPASGICHYTSHSPWDVGDIVRTHLPLSRGQQFWMVAPAFVYATETPEWSTCPEMRLMVSLGFANGIRGWFSFAYHNDPIWVSGSLQRSLAGPFLAFSDLWEELGKRMERIAAIAPLFLETVPDRLPRRWFVTSRSSGDSHSQLPPGVPSTSSFRLRGPDYNLYVIVNNDRLGMAALNIDIPSDVMEGLQIYDLTDVVQYRQWTPMNLERHTEMFPGQARFLFVAPKDVCARWRDLIATRLMEDDRRQLAFDLQLAKTYGLDYGKVEALIDSVSPGHGMEGLEVMDKARDMLVNLTYASTVISETRGLIIGAAAAACACDGALCRMLSRGKAEMARDYGMKVIPLAREFTNLRLEVQRGRGAAIIDHAQGLSKRILDLLADIRRDS